MGAAEAVTPPATSGLCRAIWARPCGSGALLNRLRAEPSPPQVCRPGRVSRTLSSGPRGRGPLCQPSPWMLRGPSSLRPGCFSPQSLRPALSPGSRGTASRAAGWPSPLPCFSASGHAGLKAPMGLSGEGPLGVFLCLTNSDLAPGPATSPVPTCGWGGWRPGPWGEGRVGRAVSFCPSGNQARPASKGLTIRAVFVLAQRFMGAVLHTQGQALLQGPHGLPVPRTRGEGKSHFRTGEKSFVRTAAGDPKAASGNGIIVTLQMPRSSENRCVDCEIRRKRGAAAGTTAMHFGWSEPRKQCCQSHLLLVPAARQAGTERIHGYHAPRRAAHVAAAGKYLEAVVRRQSQEERGAASAPAGGRRIIGWYRTVFSDEHCPSTLGA